MIHLKNRSRETRTYQYPNTVSAGPVRPQRVSVVRGKHNPKTGQVTRTTKEILVGGVLTLPPRSELKNMPDALLSHPALKRDIEARVVLVREMKDPTPKRASVAPVERRATPKPPAAVRTRKPAGDKE